MSLHAVLEKNEKHESMRETWEYKILLWENAQLDDGEIFDQSQGRIWIRRIVLIKLSQKHEFWMMWQTDQRKNMLKNFFIFQWSLVVGVNNGFHFLSKNDEIFVSTFRMRANRLIDLLPRHFNFTKIEFLSKTCFFQLNVIIFRQSAMSLCFQIHLKSEQM